MVVEGIHVKDIFELVSWVLSLIISWIFGILANEEDQHTVMFRKNKADFFVYSTQTDQSRPSEFGNSFSSLMLVLCSSWSYLYHVYNDVSHLMVE